MEFSTVKKGTKKFLIYQHAKERLEHDLFTVLLMNGIIPADFDENAFVVENDTNGVPISWQKGILPLIQGLAHVNAAIASTEE